MYSGDAVKDAEQELTVALYALDRGDLATAIGRTIDAAQSLVYEMKRARRVQESRSSC
jgi:hypothetical protein